MPIILTGVSGSVTFTGNLVANSSGVKGFMKVELLQNATSQMTILNNSFQGVAGFLYSGVLNLMKRYS